MNGIVAQTAEHYAFAPRGFARGKSAIRHRVGLRGHKQWRVYGRRVYTCFSARPGRCQREAARPTRSSSTAWEETLRLVTVRIIAWLPGI